MTEFVTSADGTRIAIETTGGGPPIIFVDGAFQYREINPDNAALANLVSEAGFTAVQYDRRGRGESAFEGGTRLADDIEDLRGVVAAVGGSAGVFAHSSGSILSLWAAQAGVPISRLALFEPPLAVEGTPADFLTGMDAAIATGDRETMLEHFMRDMPPEWIESSRGTPMWPIMQGVAPSHRTDAEAMVTAGPAESWRSSWAGVTQPVLVMYGDDTLPTVSAAASALERELPDATARHIQARYHSWDPELMASELAGFFGA